MFEKKEVFNKKQKENEISLNALTTVNFKCTKEEFKEKIYELKK